MTTSVAVRAKTFECVNCGETFKFGAWLGCHGDPTLEHKVTPRTFYSTQLGLTVHVRAERSSMDGNGRRHVVMGKFAHFHAGQCTTDDPETQEILAARYPMSKEEFVEKTSLPGMREAHLKQQLLEQASALTAAQEENERLKAELAARSSQPGERPEETSEGSKSANEEEKPAASSGKTSGKGSGKR